MLVNAISFIIELGCAVASAMAYGPSLCHFIKCTLTCQYLASQTLPMFFNCTMPRESTVDSKDEQILNQYMEQMMEEIEEFYCPINQIPGINNEIIEYLKMEERAFMEQMVLDSYLFRPIHQHPTHG